MAPPLRNLKLLDLSRQLPGPFCSMLLADLGVDVLVVAAPNDAMGIGIPLIQRNKRSMTLNLKHPEGKRSSSGSRQDADIILEGFRPGVTERLGIDYASMAKLNPRLVYCSISGYGQDGPYRDKVGPRHQLPRLRRRARHLRRRRRPADDHAACKSPTSAAAR